MGICPVGSQAFAATLQVKQRTAPVSKGWHSRFLFISAASLSQFGKVLLGSNQFFKSIWAFCKDISQWIKSDRKKNWLFFGFYWNKWEASKENPFILWILATMAMTLFLQRLQFSRSRFQCWGTNVMGWVWVWILVMFQVSFVTSLKQCDISDLVTPTGIRQTLNSDNFWMVYVSGYLPRTWEVRNKTLLPFLMK